MGKHFKKFATQAEHDNFLMTEQDVPKPNISLIENEKKVIYNPIFPLYITTWKDEDNNIHGEATTVTKKLYDYFMENSILDPTGAYGERLLYLSDNQVLYINGIKVECLIYAPKDGEYIRWYPWDIGGWYDWGGLLSDGSIYLEWDY